MNLNADSRNKPVVLVAEDDASLRLLMRKALESSGFAVEEAANGKAALAAFDRIRPDVVLLDVRMPEMDGITACAELRARPAGTHVPVLMVTGLGDLASIKQAYNAGATDFIAKPIQWRMLGCHARYMLRTARAMVEINNRLEVIQHNAYFDRLTNLPNRNLLCDRLAQATLVASRENKSAALIILGLDRFKDFNNALGHQAGDKVLQQIGPRLQKILRGSDTVARLGGDEFAVLLATKTLPEGAIEVARKITRTMAEPFILGDLQLHIEASLGIAVFPDHGEDGETLISRADTAMVVAKENRSGYTLYSEHQDKPGKDRLELLGELRRAVAEDRLLLHYQPKIDLQTGCFVGVEALVRWQHPSYGILPPDQFIPLAEQTGLIVPLTELVLQKALRQSHAWQRAGVEINMAVNLSRRNLQTQELPDIIARLLATCEVSPASLTLEITESTVMATPESAMETLSRMKQTGLRLALDDFGTGYSSLAYLKKLPVDELKIDKSFVMSMHAREEDVAIVRMIIELGHVLGLKVVAEGVETQEALDRLLALGCDLAQGYYISRPLAPQDVLRFIDAHPIH